MALNIKLNKTIKSLGGNTTPQGVIQVTGTAIDAAKLYLSAYRDRSLIVTDTAKDCFKGDRHAWRGGLERTIELLENRVNPPKQQRDFKLDKVLGAVGSSVRRVRVNSDLDGEWEYDRRTLDLPFTMMKKTPTDQTVWIEVDFAFSASVDKEQIDEYAEFIFQIISAIENRGFTCGVKLINRTIKLTTTGEAFESVLIVKEPGQYADKRFFRFFSTPMFRRVLFYVFHVGCKQLGLVPQYNLGIPSNTPRATAVKGLIKLTPGTLPQGDFMGGVISLIKTAIGAA